MQKSRKITSSRSLDLDSAGDAAELAHGKAQILDRELRECRLQSAAQGREGRLEGVAMTQAGEGGGFGPV